MPLLFFPNPDALRLALVSGIVPPDIAGQPIRAASDDAGRPWVEMPAGSSKDVVAALTRIGVSVHGPGVGPPTRDHCCWAELLPLRSTARSPSRGPILILAPAHRIARLVAEVRRIRPQRVEVRPHPVGGNAYVVVPDPPLATLLGFSSGSIPDTEMFLEAAPGVWVQVGWQHPLPDHLVAPGDTLVLIRPDRPWEIVRNDPPRGSITSLALLPQPTRWRVARASTSPLSARLILRSRSRPDAMPSLWVLDGDARTRLGELARDTDERVLRQFRAAVVSRPGSAARVVLRIAGRSPPDVLFPCVRAFVEHPTCPTLFLPIGQDLVPTVRPHALTEWLGLDLETISWMEATVSNGIVLSRVSASAFRALADLIHYHAPRPICRTAHPPAPRLFEFRRFTVEPDRVVAEDPHTTSPVETAPPDETEHEGWLTRSLGKLTDRLFRARSAGLRRPPPVSDVELGERVREKLVSQDALLGNEWAARRVATEQRVLTDLPRLSPADRASVWSELAEAYAGSGNPSDAAVCWLNAAWDHPNPPAEWAVQWLRAEVRATRDGKDGADLDAALRGPASPQSARVTAAYLAWAAGRPHPPVDIATRLPHFLAALDAHEVDMPARAVWVARQAVAALTGGDALALARCRDRLFRRLADHGPGLDLDAPSFLRFRGGAAGDRFLTAREWLVRVREPVRRWLGRLANGGKLQWAGIDPEVGCTAAYADLMFAWGQSRLGDRAQARHLEAQAIATLDRVRPGGVDPAVHRVLRIAFRDRIAAAQDGRPDRPGLPLEAAAEMLQLDDLGRYAVDRLRAVSAILEPVDLVNPYRGRDLGAFLGTDHLGERLVRLLARPDLAPDPADVRGLLAIANADPTAVTLPRVVFALLEVAPRLDAPIVAVLLPLAGKAVDLIPEWARIGVPGADPSASAKRFGSRLLTSACHAAGLFHLPDAFRRATEVLLSAAGTPGAMAMRVFGPVAGRFFRTLRKLGLTTVASDLLAQLHTEDGGLPVGPHDLGLAVGWFAVGNEDAGNGVLNAARDRLFVTGVADVRERTTLAIAYAAALGHAPPGIALGRLEELFLRLDAVTTHGATNRYYTPKPLELIDTVIRAVVSDDFALGPGVRGWLDDDEYLIRKRISRDLESAMTHDPESP